MRITARAIGLKLVMMGIFLSFTLPAEAAQKNIKSFKEWKAEQVHIAQSNLRQLKSKAGGAHAHHSRQQVKMNRKDPNLVKNANMEAYLHQDEEQSLEFVIQAEENKFEMTKELSVTDYFVGYLAKQSNRKEAYKEAAGKLSADEVAELLAAYANSVFDGRSTEILPSASEQGLREQ